MLPGLKLYGCLIYCIAVGALCVIGLATPCLVMTLGVSLLKYTAIMPPCAICSCYILQQLAAFCCDL
jgi:hypothetical protein